MVPPPKIEVLVSKRFEVCVKPEGPILTDRKGAIVLSGRDGDSQEHVDAAATGEDGIAIAGRRSTATTLNGGISIAGDGGEAACGDSGAAIVAGDGVATSGNGCISFVVGYNGTSIAGAFSAAVCHHHGTSQVGPTSFASVNSGSAFSDAYGISSVRTGAEEVRSGPRGLSIAWVRLPITAQNADGTPYVVGWDDGVAVPGLLRKISAGDGGIIISFFMDQQGRRQPVVGFVGDNITPKVQTNLTPDQAYKLSDDGEFVPA